MTTTKMRMMVAMTVFMATSATATPGAAGAVGSSEETRKHLERLVQFNHPMPLAGNPFRDPTVLPDRYSKTPEDAVCALEFFEETKLLYQLAPVARTEVDAETQQVVHAGPCGVCSTLKDLVVLADFERTQSYEHAHQPCVAIGIISRDFAVECYRDLGFTAPCAELQYFRALKGFYSCSWKCVLEMDLSQECYTACEAAATDEIFQLAAGLHFSSNSSRILESLELPPIDEKRIKEDEAWVQPKYNQSFLDMLATKEAINPPLRPAIDPYLDRSFDTWIDPDEVCAVKFEAPSNKRYEIQTYKNEQAARDDGAIITHQFGCGLCSSLWDLIVYIGTPDLTTPVRRCALKSFVSENMALNCLYELGFSPPCADMWLYNARNTRKRCMSICMKLMNAPNNLPDGSLNRCIACDEEMSGPHFKKGSARTRRDSGIHSAISRPGPAVYPLVHKYPPTSPDGSSAKPEPSASRDEL